MPEDLVPSWPELLGRMVAARASLHTLAAECRFAEPGNGGADRPLVSGTVQFWFGAPNRWRVESEGELTQLADGQRVLVRAPDGRMQCLPATAIELPGGAGRPQTLLGDPIELFLRDTRFPAPTGRPALAEVGGRRAWEVELATTDSAEPARLVAVDAETGLLVRLASDDDGTFVELADLQVNQPLPDELFHYGGEVDVSLLEQGRDLNQALEWLEDHPPQVPQYWPGGPGWLPVTGDPRTGAYTIMLEVSGAPVLDRRPRTDTPFRPRGGDRREVYRWEDDQWQWALVADRTFTPAQLEQIIASIGPSERPW